mgnify:CR=1 FL=1
MPLPQGRTGWESHLPHPLHGRYAPLRTTLRRACRAPTTAMVEICNEGPRSGSSHPQNEDHTGSDIDIGLAYVVRLRLEDTRVGGGCQLKHACNELAKQDQQRIKTD